MLRCAGVPGDLAVHQASLLEAIRSGRALAAFRSLIQAQSGDPRVCDDPDRLPTAPVRHVVPAPRGGVVTAVDALAVGLASKSLGAGRDRKDDPIDYAVGIVVQKKVGDAVEPDEPLAVIHAQDAGRATAASARVEAAFTLGERVPPRPMLLRRISQAGIERLDAEP